MRKVVYTAIFGARDTLPVIREIPLGWDFICFTSEDDIVAEGPWRVIHKERIFNNAKDARYYKVASYNSEIIDYDLSVWIDANISLNVGWEDAITEGLSSHDIAFLKHWENVRGAYHEGRRCVSMKKDTEDNISEALLYCRKQGLPDDIPVSATGIIARKHNKFNVVNFLTIWWKLIKDYTHRDQVVLPYARWVTELDYAEMLYVKHPGHWFSIGPHRTRVK